MSEFMEWEATIPMTAVPKARPRVTKHGTYMPKRYRDNKEALGWMIRRAKPPSFDGPVEIQLTFSAEAIHIRLAPSERSRPKGVRGDLDNLIGTITDVLQDMGVIANDRSVHQLEGSFNE